MSTQELHIPFSALPPDGDKMALFSKIGCKVSQCERRNCGYYPSCTAVTLPKGWSIYSDETSLIMVDAQDRARVTLETLNHLQGDSSYLQWYQVTRRLPAWPKAITENPNVDCKTSILITFHTFYGVTCTAQVVPENDELTHLIIALKDGNDTTHAVLTRTIRLTDTVEAICALDTLRSRIIPEWRQTYPALEDPTVQWN